MSEPGREQWHNRRKRAVRKVTLSATKTNRKAVFAAGVEGGEGGEYVAAAAEESSRPATRGDCRGVARPCPWAGCRHHLYLDVATNGSLILNFPDLEPDELVETCSLDVADAGEHRLETVGDLLNLTRERARQIEARALARLAVPDVAKLVSGDA